MLHKVLLIAKLLLITHTWEWIASKFIALIHSELIFAYLNNPLQHGFVSLTLISNFKLSPYLSARTSTQEAALRNQKIAVAIQQLSQSTTATR